MKAETPKDKMNEMMEAALKEAGLARTSAITLSGLDYAEDLSKVLLSHVQNVEDLFKDVQLLSKKEGATEKEFKKMIKKVEAKAEGTKKLQASPVSESLTLCLLEVWPAVPAHANSFRDMRIGIKLSIRLSIHVSTYPTNLSINLSIYLSIYLDLDIDLDMNIYLKYIHSYLNLSICLSIYPSIYLSVYLSIYLLTYISYIYLSFHLSFHPSIHPSTYLSVYYLSIYLPTYLSIYLSTIYLSINLSM